MSVCAVVLPAERESRVKLSMSRKVPGRHIPPVTCLAACQQGYGTMLSSVAVLLALAVLY